MKWGGASGIAIIGSMSTLVYTLAMKVPSGLHVPANVKDSLDEALLVAEGLPAQAAEALKAAGRSAFDQSFFCYHCGCNSIFGCSFASSPFGRGALKEKRRC